MFCIKCGKEAVTDKFCESCFLEGMKLFSVENIKLYFCDNCEKFHHKREKYDNESVEKFILGIIIKSENRLTKKIVDFKVQDGKIECVVKVEGYINPAKTKKSQEAKFNLYTKRRKCENCVRLLGGYHEAVIQIRGKDMDVILDKTKRRYAKYIVRVEGLKEGYNVKIMNKTIAQKVAKTFSSKYSIKKTHKLVGEKKGKKIYRNFFAIR